MIKQNPAVVHSFVLYFKLTRAILSLPVSSMAKQAPATVHPLIRDHFIILGQFEVNRIHVLCKRLGTLVDSVFRFLKALLSYHCCITSVSTF